MSRYSFFKEADPSILSVERRKQLQDFANYFVPLANSYGYVDNEVVSILHNLQPDHTFLTHEVWSADFFNADDPSADLMPLLLDEGLDLSIELTQYYDFDMTDWRDETSKGGLHQAHFRMALPNQNDRVEATARMAESSAISGLAGDAGALTITQLSAFSFDGTDLSQIEDEESDVAGFTLGQIAKGFWLDESEEKWSLATFYKIMSRMVELRVKSITPKSREDWTQHLSMVCREHLPIVYNMGYRMAASGKEMHEVIAQVEKMIVKCTKTLQSRPELCSAIRRQALVNFCSAFPESLMLIDLDPCELYGCTKDGTDLGEALDQAQEVFGGPLKAFTFDALNVANDFRSHIAKTLNQQGLGFKLDYLQHARSYGLLFNMPEIFDGLEHPSPTIKEKGLGWLYELHGKLQAVASMKDWVKHIFTPDSVQHYEDVELLAVIESAVAHNKPGDLKAIFKARPQLAAPAVDLLIQHDRVNVQFFDAFGFDRKELALTGSKATVELIERQLGTDLGL